MMTLLVPILLHFARFTLAGSNPELEAKLGGGYSWVPSDHPSFFPGRQATISARGQQVRLCHAAIHHYTCAAHVQRMTCICCADRLKAALQVQLLLYMVVVLCMPQQQ
jgi:hypothetical protein